VRSKRVCRGFLTLVLVTVLAFLPHAGADETTFRPIRVVLVRHAERASDPKEDPPLSESGRRRAEALADLLGKSGVTALYSSDRLRARQTLQPLGERLGLPVHTIDAGDVTATARAVMTYLGGVVVVAGHSNTLGPIIEALGGEKIPEITEDDFDNVFVVTVHAPEKATVLRLRWRP
jgi:2,3-bisphosphoglycerate-dependent phosphoglycerate mutase